MLMVNSIWNLTIKLPIYYSFIKQIVETLIKKPGYIMSLVVQEQGSFQHILRYVQFFNRIIWNERKLVQKNNSDGL